MPAIVLDTITDVRTGRSSWRVVLACSIPSFAIAFLVALVQFTR